MKVKEDLTKVDIIRTILEEYNGSCSLEVLRSQLNSRGEKVKKLRQVIKKHPTELALEKVSKSNKTEEGYRVHSVHSESHKFTRPSLKFMFEAIYSIHEYYGSSQVWPDTVEEFYHQYENTLCLKRKKDILQLLLDQRYIQIKDRYSKKETITWNIGRIQDMHNQMPKELKLAITYPNLTTRLDSEIIPSPIALAGTPQVHKEKKRWKLQDGTRCIFVDDIETLQEYVSDCSSSFKREINRDGRVVLAIDCEGVPDSLELIQIATRSGVVIIDSKTIGEETTCNILEPYLTSQKYVKLVHDLHMDAVAISKFGQIKMQGTLDTQLVAEYIWGDNFLGFNGLMKKLGIPQHQSKEFLHARMDAGIDIFSSRPLPATHLEYAALDVALLLNAAEPILEILGVNDWNRLIQASDLRVLNAIKNAGSRTICFDKADYFALKSSELLRVVKASDGFFGEPLRIQNEIDDVISLLPNDLKSKLTKNNSPSIFPWIDEIASSDSKCLPVEKLEKMSDIVLDIGRRPHCWIGEERVFLSEKESKVVSSKDIKNLSDSLGTFGSDNRAGLDRKLHRFSAMRNRDGCISGITIRIGRTVIGNAAMLMDLLMGSDKSILILGEPGAGKTTIVREATRKLANHKNVIVVDTSNEIAGDGLIPHECIGFARRMMVPSLDKQSAIMVECVQNHTPHVMVIDEIGRVNEVIAARTVKQRGVRMIASAHGDLRKLLKNKELRGLVGGVESVTLGDNLARDEAKRKKKLSEAAGVENPSSLISKTKAQRCSEPTFEIIVEVSRSARHEWRIVLDSAKAVDRILDGLKYHAQLRSREPSTGKMFLQLIQS